MSTSPQSARKEATRFMQLAYSSQMNGRLEEAIELYRRSIEAYPTAEAHTFLGWTYSFLGEYERAIDECKLAIQIDPDFGNPYNDIGAYLIRLNRHEEAVTWLELAVKAKRYDARHYPCYNLGRAYERIGEYDAAIGAYHRAIELEPEYSDALVALEKLQAWMN